MDGYLDYYHTDGDMKCKLFAFTLAKSPKDWFKSLPSRSICFWSDLYETFIAHFIAMKRQPTTMVSLSGVTRGKKEIMHAYINHFTKVEVVVEESNRCLS